MDLSLDNVFNISVSEAPLGVGEYNTSNLALFTDEIPANTFGNLGYALYLSPTQVGIDFGTGSKTFQMANSVFSQSPNILANNGNLVVIPLIVAVQHVAFSGIPASGSFELVYGALPTAAINWDDTASMIQAKLRAVVGLEGVAVTGSMATSLNISMGGLYGPQGLLTTAANSLMTSAPAAITPTVTTQTAGETMAAAISRTVGLVQYFGIMVDEILAQADMLAAAAVTQTLNKLEFFVSRNAADIAPGGMLDLLRTGSLHKSRGLYYGGATDISAILYMASYAGRALSVNFNGSNTTLTMHLKDLATVQPDPTMTQTLLGEAQAAGADVYVSLQGVAKVFTSGANKFFDQVYNLGWFVGELQVAGFNYLATTSTKIPQTESGMDGLKKSQRDVCEQGVTNQYLAPGTWNSSTTFGIQSDFLANISQRGYYIYSQPISQQLQTARIARQAPLIQIAAKEAGAIHSGNVIVNINA